MKTICLFAFVAVIVIVWADHSQHQAGAKPGDVVHWVTSNTKGADTLNHTTHANQATGFKTPTTTTAASTTTTTTVAGGQTAEATVDQVKETAAPTPAPEAAKDTAESVTTTEASTTTTAAAAKAKDGKPAESKTTHK